MITDFPFDFQDPANYEEDQVFPQIDIQTGTNSNFFEATKIAEVQFLNLKPDEPNEPYKVFYKKQYRKNHVTRQLVKHGGHGVIYMRAKTNLQLVRIWGWVKREDQAAAKMKDENGEVAIKNEDTGEQLNLLKDTDIHSVTEDGCTLQPFSVDLHEIYQGNSGCRPVFELSRSDNDRRLNLFQLVIQLEFVDFSYSQKFYSPIFNLRTEPQSTPHVPKKRKIDQEEKHTSHEVALLCSPGGSMDSGLSDEVPSRHHQILVDMLDARTAKIGKLVAHDFRVSTSGADLAYYMALKEPEDYSDLEEGDLIGFFKDEETGQTYIQRLRSDNIHKALHAGVVSRSHYLAGHKPSNPNIKTDTICVIGIVNVKVVGSVENGERIYASTNDPGKAIPASHMPVGSFLRKKHVLLGMALETKKCTKELDDVLLVKCFVCIVLDVSRKELLEEIEDLYEVNEKRTEEQIKIANKKNWRRIRGCVLSSLIIIGVIIFILYQWLVPGSMFRYWLCRRGCIPNHHLYYSYTDTNTNRVYDVHGIEFTWQVLQDKVGIVFSPNTRNANGSSIFYYLNVDRCAYYWADGAAGNNIGGRKYIGGSRILSVIKNCSVVDELIEGDDQWQHVKEQNNVTCEPMLN